MEILLNLILVGTLVDCSRILVINPTPSYSHQIVIHPIVEELSNRGHSIVFATTHPMRNDSLKNVKEIDLGLSAAFIKMARSVRPSPFNMAFDILEMFAELSDTHLAHPEMQNLITNSSEYFDLVMIEYFVPTMYAFKVRFDCPFIGFLSLGAYNSDHRNLGDFDNPAMYPDVLISKGPGDTFMQRVYNVFLTVISELHRNYILHPRINKIIASHFGGTYPDVGEIASDVDMFFITSNLFLSAVRPTTPATVSIGGGIHIREPKELPENIKKLLDNSKRGVVYISFGSNVQSSTLSTRVKQVFLKTFAELPYDFLWKFEEEGLPNKAENVQIMKWVPQQDVLRHANVKLFITQAGLQSSEEAVYNQKPMLAIPFFADQPYNAYYIVKNKIGLMIEDVDQLTYHQLKYALLELLENSTYTENVKRLGRIVKDEPLRPIEKAVWWTEYVLRHKGAKHLKGPIVPFYQRYLFDVFAAFLLFLVFLVYCIFIILRVRKSKKYLIKDKFKSN